MCSNFSSEENHLLRKTAKEVFWRFCAQAPDPESMKEDLLHFGVVGMLEARKNFDPERGVPWLNFARLRVRGEMIDHLRKAPVIRLPQEVQQKVKAVKEARLELARGGRDDSRAALAEHLGWSIGEVSAVEALVPSLVGIEGSNDDDDEKGGYSGVTLISRTASPEAAVIHRNLAVTVQLCLAGLNPLERLVILGRMLEGLKLRELAGPMGCSEENVRIKEKKGLAQLRECLEKSGDTFENLTRLFE